MNLYTIGTNKKTACDFFHLLRQSKVSTVIDTRLNNKSQLAGFTKHPDLAYFLMLHNIGYKHETILAPEKQLLNEYRKKHKDWNAYSTIFNELMKLRAVETQLDRNMYHDACLLCACDTDKHCHRFLVADYLKESWSGVEVEHLF